MAPQPTPLPITDSTAIAKLPKVVPTVASIPPADAIEAIQPDSLAQPEKSSVDPARVAPVPPAVTISAEEAIRDWAQPPETGRPEAPAIQPELNKDTAKTDTPLRVQ